METNIIDIKKRDRIRVVKNILTTIVAACISSIGLHSFVYPSNFVPLGLEAAVTLIYYYLPMVNPGYINLLLNLPLVIYALIKLDKKYIIYTVFFTLLSSLVLILLEAINFPIYDAGEYNRLLAAVFAGILLGARSGLMLKIGSSTGGVDIIARAIQGKAQHVNIERLITYLCLILIGTSYFVYKDVNSILLGLVSMFFSERVTALLLVDSRKAVEVKIVTKHPEEIREDLVINLRHGATLIQSKGLYTGDDNSVILCILNVYQMADFIRVIKKYPNTFVYYSDVNGVYGNFRRYKDEVVK